MSVWEIVLIGAALAMDAVAVSMAGGMAEPRLSMGKALAMAVKGKQTLKRLTGLRHWLDTKKEATVDLNDSSFSEEGNYINPPTA